MYFRSKNVSSYDLNQSEYTFPVSASRIFTLRSKPAVASVLPSGEKAANRTPPDSSSFTLADRDSTRNQDFTNQPGGLSLLGPSYWNMPDGSVQALNGCPFGGSVRPAGTNSLTAGSAGTVCGINTAEGTSIAPMTERRQGTLVGITSVAGVRGLPGAGAYSASKAAASRYLESLRVELRALVVDEAHVVPAVEGQVAGLVTQVAYLVRDPLRGLGGDGCGQSAVLCMHRGLRSLCLAQRS